MKKATTYQSQTWIDIHARVQHRQKPTKCFYVWEFIIGTQARYQFFKECLYQKP